jgi:hypothetical protein
MSVNPSQSGARILSLDDSGGVFGSEPALYVSHGSSDEEDKLVLELVSDQPIAEIGVIGESNVHADTVDLDAGIAFERIGNRDGSGLIHYKVTLTPNDLASLRTDKAIKKATVKLDIRYQGNASHSVLEYDFLLLQPHRINQTYYKIAQLPEIKNSVLGKFAAGIFRVSTGMQHLMEKNFKDVELPISTESGKTGRLSKKDVFWLAIVNEKMHELFLTGMAYYYSKYLPDKMPDVLVPYKDLASAAWKKSIDSCMAYNDSEETVSMLDTAGAGSVPSAYDAGRLGMLAYSAVMGSGEKLPLGNWTAGQSACFADLGTAHLSDDVRRIESEVGNGSRSAWKTAMIPAREETAGSISIEDMATRMILAGLVQAIYYDITVKPAQRDAILQFRGPSERGSHPKPIPTPIDWIVDSYE